VATTRKSALALAGAALGVGGLLAILVGEAAGLRTPRPDGRPHEATMAATGPATTAASAPGSSPVFLRRAGTGAASAHGSLDGAPSPSVDAAETDAESQAAAELSRAMARLVSDLEYNSNRGLPEPPQQTVRPAAPPWRPPPGAGSMSPPVIEQVLPARGSTRGGTRVTLRGRHLRASSVMFGSAPAGIVERTDRSVIVLAPPSEPGPVTIAVTNEDGSYALAPTSFTFAD